MSDEPHINITEAHETFLLVLFETHEHTATRAYLKARSMLPLEPALGELIDVGYIEDEGDGVRVSLTPDGAAIAYACHPDHQTSEETR